MQASVLHDGGSTKLLDRMGLLSAQYALRQATGQPRPPLAPLGDAARRVMLAAHGHNAASLHYEEAVTTWKDAAFAAAHHLPRGPGRHPQSGGRARCSADRS